MNSFERNAGLPSESRLKLIGEKAAAEVELRLAEAKLNRLKTELSKDVELHSLTAELELVRATLDEREPSTPVQATFNTQSLEIAQDEYDRAKAVYDDLDKMVNNTP